MINTILDFATWFVIGIILYIYIGYDIFEWIYIHIEKWMNKK